MIICPVCAQPVYQCETCGGTGTREEGRYWNGKEYQHYPAMKCPWCVDGMLVHEHGEKAKE